MVDSAMASTAWKPLQWAGLRPIPTARTSKTNIEHLKFPSETICNRGLTVMASAGSNPGEWRFFWEHQKPRNVCAQAGRSKKKAGQSSSGRLEGRAEERRAQEMIAERRRRLRATKIPVKPKVKKPWKESELYRFLYGEDPKEEFTEDELQMIGLGYERTVRFKEPDDPSLRHPLDWYKYGPYSPHARKGVVVGKPVRGTMSDMRVTMFSTVKDAEEQERIDQNDAVVDYESKIRVFDESIGVKYFWVFARAAYRVKPQVPWDEWTLVSQVAVESGEDLDKYRLGAMVGKSARNLITQCTAWFRPDLIYIKRPIYQARFEPQEEFFRRLVELIDPLTEEAHRFAVPGGREMGTYYGCLCMILGVEASASDDDAVSAYEKLDDERRSLCWDFVLSNHPVKILHPFTKEWRAREQAIAAASSSSEMEDEEEGEDGEVSVEMEMDAVEDSSAEQEMFWEKEFKNSLRDLEDQKFEDLEMNEEGTEVGSEDAELKPNVLSGIGGTEGSRERWNPADSTAEGEDGMPNESENSRDREFTVKAAVRPFTYNNFLREIVLLRQALVEHRADTCEPISSSAMQIFGVYEREGFRFDNAGSSLQSRESPESEQTRRGSSLQSRESPESEQTRRGSSLQSRGYSRDHLGQIASHIPVYEGYTDGASRHTRNISSTAWILYSSAGRRVSSGGFFLGHATNNVAEYSAVIELLVEAILLGIFGVIVRLDSQLVASQLNGTHQNKKMDG